MFLIEPEVGGLDPERSGENKDVSFFWWWDGNGAGMARELTNKEISVVARVGLYNALCTE
jgi:hypothetical protein